MNTIKLEDGDDDDDDGEGERRRLCVARNRKMFILTNN